MKASEAEALASQAGMDYMKRQCKSVSRKALTEDLKQYIKSQAWMVLGDGMSDVMAEMLALHLTAFYNVSKK